MKIYQLNNQPAFPTSEKHPADSMRFGDFTRLLKVLNLLHHTDFIKKSYVFLHRW